MVRSEVNAHTLEEAGIQGTVLHEVYNGDHVLHNGRQIGRQVLGGKVFSVKKAVYCLDLLIDFLHAGNKTLPSAQHGRSAIGADVGAIAPVEALLF